MCNLYSITRSREAMRRLFRVNRDLTGNRPAFPAVCPDTMAPIVHTARDGERELAMMRWGFPLPPISALRPIGAQNRMALSCSSNDIFANGQTVSRR
jgi:putative SOS response-associated peptidase YedK